MNKQNIYISSLLLLFITTIGILPAQEIVGGAIKYQQTTRFNFPDRDSQRWKDLVAELPKENVSSKVLYFTHEASLYEENLSDNEAPLPGLRRAQHIMNMTRPPKPNTRKVYFNFKKSKKIEQLEFMTRDFIVESDIENMAWKLGKTMKKILGNTCMEAKLIIDTDTIVAWFTSEIPFSVGPGEYYGLPGCILAVEKNGETILLANSIKLTPPEKGLIIKPSNGKKVTQEQLNKIIEDKVKEFKETRREGRGKGMHGHR